MTARVCAGVNGRFSLPTSSTSPLAEKMRRETDESQSSLASRVADRGEPSSKTAGSLPRKASTSVRAGIDPKIVPNSPCSRTDDSRHTPKRPCPRPASRHASPKQPTPSRRSSWMERPRFRLVFAFDSRASPPLRRTAAFLANAAVAHNAPALHAFGPRTRRPIFQTAKSFEGDVH